MDEQAGATQAGRAQHPAGKTDLGIPGKQPGYTYTSVQAGDKVKEHVGL